MKKGADFAGCYLRGVSNFSFAQFDGRLNLKDCKFLGGVNFSHSKFLGEVHGRYFWARGEFGFKNVVVQENLDLSESRFSGEISFKDSVFKKSINFRDTRFEGAVDFSYVIFEDFSFFSGAVFGTRLSKTVRPINFTGAAFKKPSNFIAARFGSAYPNWQGTVIHENSSFSCDGTNWPLKGVEDVFVAKESCATIRHLLAKKGLPEDEHFFFRREMQFARQIGSFWQRLPYHLFGIFSEYGYSIKRPLWWLFGLWVFGFAAFCGLPFQLLCPEAAVGH